MKTTGDRKVTVTRFRSDRRSNCNVSVSENKINVISVMIRLNVNQLLYHLGDFKAMLFWSHVNHCLDI